MKKYLSLFIVLAMAFSVSNIVKAEDDASTSGGKEVNASVSTEGTTINTTTNVKSGSGILTPEQKRINAETRLKAQADLKLKNEANRAEVKIKKEAEKAEIKIRKEENKAEVKVKREAAKEEVKLKKEEMQAEFKLKREALKNENDARREEIKQKMEDLREKIKEEKDTIKAKIKEERITGREKDLERFEAAVERMNNIKDRVNDYIIKLEAKGVDVANAKNFVATAETKLNAAVVKITEANTLLSASIDELTSEDKTKLRTLAQETQTLIKEAHQALNDAIKSLKEALKAKIEADKASTAANTSTDTNTTSTTEN